MGRTRVAATSEIGVGQMRKVVVDGTAICLVRTEDGTFYAIDDRCTHEGGSLSEGEQFEVEIVCPLHGSTFDLRTGEATGAPATTPVQTYRVILDGDDVTVEI